MAKHRSWVSDAEEQLRSEQRAIVKTIMSSADKPASVEDLVLMERLDEIENLLE